MGSDRTFSDMQVKADNEGPTLVIVIIVFCLSGFVAFQFTSHQWAFAKEGIITLTTNNSKCPSGEHLAKVNNTSGPGAVMGETYYICEENCPIPTGIEDAQAFESSHECVNQTWVER